MDVSSMLGLESLQPAADGSSTRQTHHPYSTRHGGNTTTMTTTITASTEGAYGAGDVSATLQNTSTSDSAIDDKQSQCSPTNDMARKHPPKLVTFSLLLSESSHVRARLPLRVGINTHDTTESIITTVKNFYGLYEGEGVSFEDGQGKTLIAQYENLTHNAMVYVKVMNDQIKLEESAPGAFQGVPSPRKPKLDEPFQLMPTQPLSRPSSRAMKRGSPSPSAAAGLAGFSAIRSLYARPKAKTFNSQQRHGEENDLANGLSDSDAGSVSVSSSRRAKSDQLASAEISLDNIVEGGRRKRAKFESSELPLFAPPQVPVTASHSSLSPQRRNPSLAMKSPLPPTNHYNFTYNQPLPSPQSFGHSDFGPKLNGNFVAPGAKNTSSQVHGHRLRARGSGGNLGNQRLSGGSANGALPTPDPTIGGSVMSDEDVALQLMRLGDASNISSHGRLSASTMDDALSGKADAASSDEDSDGFDDNRDGDEENISPTGQKHARELKHPYVGSRKRHKTSHSSHKPYEEGTYSSADEYEDHKDATFRGGENVVGHDTGSKSRSKTSAKSGGGNRARSVNSFNSKSKSRSSLTKPKSKPVKPPQSPYAATPGARSNIPAPIQQLATDEEDLSSKPRCQRCRKSKKGCDRQRPCQRCKDAGIGIEGCISEDEGNGRKGRFGRHMGVTIKKGTSDAASVGDSILAASPSNETTEHHFFHHQHHTDESLAANGFAENNKKRKR